MSTSARTVRRRRQPGHRSRSGHRQGEGASQTRWRSLYRAAHEGDPPTGISPHRASPSPASWRSVSGSGCRRRENRRRIERRLSVCPRLETNVFGTLPNGRPQPGPITGDDGNRTWHPGHTLPRGKTGRGVQIWPCVLKKSLRTGSGVHSCYGTDASRSPVPPARLMAKR